VPSSDISEIPEIADYRSRGRFLGGQRIWEFPAHNLTVCYTYYLVAFVYSANFFHAIFLYYSILHLIADTAPPNLMMTSTFKVMQRSLETTLILILSIITYICELQYQYLGY